jgi:hypothetical protein
MLTVHQAVQAYLSGLEIERCDPEPGADRCGGCTTCNVRRQRDALRAHMEARFAVSEFLISGSFGRRTAIAPLNDIDLFVVLDPVSEAGLRASPPRAVLDRVLQALDAAYPTKEKPKAQSRSVNVEFKGTGLSFDVVPAFPLEDGAYQIPDRDAGAWIRTNPRVHKAHATAANERAGQAAKPIAKALKSWNRRQPEKLLRSFHLELMVYEALGSKPDSRAAGIAAALRAMAVRVHAPMPEPAGLGPDVDAGMSIEERARASAALSAAAERAELALQAAARGATGEAHHHWSALLGPGYPEEGTSPPRGGPAVLSGAPGLTPDPQHRRFG